MSTAIKKQAQIFRAKNLPKNYKVNQLCSSRVVDVSYFSELGAVDMESHIAGMLRQGYAVRLVENNEGLGKCIVTLSVR